MTGVTLPDSMSCAQDVRSSAFSEFDERGERLADERGKQQGADRAVEAAEPPAAGFAADDDERPSEGQRASQRADRAVAADVEDHVVARAPSANVLDRCSR